MSAAPRSRPFPSQDDAGSMGQIVCASVASLSILPCHNHKLTVNFPFARGDTLVG